MYSLFLTQLEFLYYFIYSGFPKSHRQRALKSQGCLPAHSDGYVNPSVGKLRGKELRFSKIESMKVLYFSLQKFLNPHKYKTLVKFIVMSHPPVEKKVNNYFIATIIHRS